MTRRPADPPTASGTSSAATATNTTATTTTIAAACAQCGSDSVTHLSMTLTDGTPVDFTSCHACEHKSWRHDGRELDREEVLRRTRKQSG